jgi:hypothetical protein
MTSSRSGRSSCDDHSFNLTRRLLVRRLLDSEEQGPSVADVFAHVSTDEADIDEITARKDVHTEETALPVPAINMRALLVLQGSKS